MVVTRKVYVPAALSPGKELMVSNTKYGHGQKSLSRSDEEAKVLCLQVKVFRYKPGVALGDPGG
jgi:hypothetical protein